MPQEVVGLSCYEDDDQFQHCTLKPTVPFHLSTSRLDLTLSLILLPCGYLNQFNLVPCGLFKSPEVQCPFLFPL